jgi:adenine deaminase
VALAAGLLADMFYFEDLTSLETRPCLEERPPCLTVLSGFSGGCPAGKKSSETVKIRTFHPEAPKVPASGSKIRVIGVKPGQAVTDSLVLSWPAEKGFYEARPEAGIVKMAAWSRYQEERVPQIGFLRGRALRGGLAQTVSHDSHQQVCASSDDGDILLAARTAASLNG